MRSLLQFRIVAWISVVTLGLITAANLTLDVLKASSSVSHNKLVSPSEASVDQACLASVINFDRKDARVECAMARSIQALSAPGPNRPPLNEQAQATVILALSRAPHESRLWLALALLRSQVNQPNVDALKMSYLTGPFSLQLIPPRLASAASGDALADEDLRVLAAADIRVILTVRKDLKGAIVDAYRKASSIGKTFIEEKASVLDPQFTSSLRNGT
jgi:hypothetical protein